MVGGPASFECIPPACRLLSARRCRQARRCWRLSLPRVLLLVDRVGMDARVLAGRRFDPANPGLAPDSQALGSTTRRKAELEGVARIAPVVSSAYLQSRTTGMEPYVFEPIGDFLAGHVAASDAEFPEYC